ncbi:MAG: fibronectin type III domain-containing protein [Burkholderiales bacterium]|nr:fibronectin type III domain-containing protein [Burkholderiales bacterium]
MAVQMEVAYSSVFKGAGVIAGGPYDCAAQNNYTGCMYSASPSVSGLISATKSRSGSSIDNISNLAAHKIFMFSGTSDTTVGQGVMNALQSYYTTSPALVPSGNIKYVNNVNAVHTFPTDFDSTGNNACNNSTSPYISNCGYDAAGALLQQIYGPLNARNNGTLGGQYIQFDQSQFIANPNTYGMDTTGWLYVPAACASGSQCKLHVAFHGCLQYQGSIGQKFVQNTGYTKWADTNNIIVLFPQTVADSTTHTTADSGSLSNANGCWDWVGWYGSNFDTRQGVQISAVKAMIDKITSGYSALAAPTGLSVTGSTNSSISLSWSAVSGASGYNVQRNGSQVNSGTITSTAYTDSGLTSGTSYSYTVTAVNSSGGQSARSATVNGTTTGTPPAVPVPTGLSVSAVTASTATLSWSAASGVSGYNVYRATTSGGPYSKLNSALVTATSYGDSGLAASTTYYWGVTAVNSGGTEGAMSSAVSATTSAAAVCYTDNNYNQVAAGRAYQSGGYAYANGSNQNMGLWNLYVTTTLKQTGTNYYVIGTCP